MNLGSTKMLPHAQEIPDCWRLGGRREKTEISPRDLCWLWTPPLVFVRAKTLGQGTFSLIQCSCSHTHILPFTCLMVSSKHWKGLLGKQDIGLTHLVHGLYVFPYTSKTSMRLWAVEGLRNYLLKKRRPQDKMSAVILDKILLSSQYCTKETPKLKNHKRIETVLWPQPIPVKENWHLLLIGMDSLAAL